MLLFFLSSTCGFNLLEMRIQEARIHTPKYNFVPSKDLFPSEPAGFASRGWVVPGEYPQEDELSYWINDQPNGNYTVEKQKRFCLTRKNSTDFLETCYTHIMSTFLWGESIRLSDKYLCASYVCHFTLASTPITVEKKVSALEKFDKIPRPPKPWKLHSQLTSQLNLEGDMYDDTEGFFWYKPIYWATSYHIHRIVISAYNTTSSWDVQALIYPVSKAEKLEGLFGFHTGPVEHGMKFQRPSMFELYSKKD